MNAMEQIMLDRFLTRVAGDKFSQLISEHLGEDESTLKEIVSCWVFFPSDTRKKLRECLTPDAKRRLGDIARMAAVDNDAEFNQMVDEGYQKLHGQQGHLCLIVNS